MSAVKGRNTLPELALRRTLFASGLRFRVNDRSLPGRPDIVFRGPHVVVFVDGDFWHGGGWRERGFASFEDQFGTNRSFWIDKIKRNIERDAEATRALENRGWTVLRFLTSEIEDDIDRVAMRVITQVRQPSSH